MDRAQLLNDLQEAIRSSLDGRQVGIWTAMPCIVQSVNFTNMTIEAQPAIQGTLSDQNGKETSVDYPLLINVPIVFPSAGGFTITFPIAQGDEVLVIFASRCIDAWWQNGGNANRPMEKRMHDLSDGFAIPGPKSVPNALPSIDPTNLQIRNNAGTTYIQIGADGKLKFANAAADLKGILTDLETLLNTFMSALAALAGGGAPTPQAALQAPGAAAVAALAPVLVKIGALLS